MSFVPYLSFQGQCAEAFAFYGDVFGAKPVLSPFSDIPEGGDMPPLPEEQQGWILHAQLVTGDGAMLMGADMPPQFGGKPQAGVSVGVWKGDAGEAQALFDRLADGGEVIMPFSQTFFAEGFGMCRDRFGTSWMVSTGDPTAAGED
ncbi:VOC family protein [Paracoccus aerodenitrificans]|uniref:VOC family protein n=1 Tax=Paracoccus aerodenitrificans TaxID=3017781 RepID=UPI0022F05878|nr:VOC family protein [Paracoccus aerodenitrificans]WBU64070.1 VOC family protein [Paracoccus aerodenitrificans]